jgi:hypothetical protein
MARIAWPPAAGVDNLGTRLWTSCAQHCGQACSRRRDDVWTGRKPSRVRALAHASSPAPSLPWKGRVARLSRRRRRAGWGEADPPTSPHPGRLRFAQPTDPPLPGEGGCMRLIRRPAIKAAGANRRRRPTPRIDSISRRSLYPAASRPVAVARSGPVRDHGACHAGAPGA